MLNGDDIGGTFVCNQDNGDSIPSNQDIQHDYLDDRTHPELRPLLSEGKCTTIFTKQKSRGVFFLILF